MILASKYMGLMGDSRASVRDSALILASVADPSGRNEISIDSPLVFFVAVSNDATCYVRLTIWTARLLVVEKISLSS